MDVYWLEQRDADVPTQDQWLSSGEILALSRLRFARRRDDWRLGRWTAKRALAACFDLQRDLLSLAKIEIRAAASGAPAAFVFNQAAPVNISISHRAGSAMCAVALSGFDVGCDLEMIERRSNAFVADYFTAREQTLVERTLVEQRPLLVTLLWSAKESALKALRVGLRLSTNCLDVDLVGGLPLHTEPFRPDFAVVPVCHVNTDGWRPLHVRYSGDRLFYGWWRHTGHMVRTVVSDSAGLDGRRPCAIASDHRRSEISSIQP